MVESVGNPRYGIYDRDFFVSLKNSNQLAAPLRAFLAKQEAAVQAGTLGDANAADPARPAGEVSAPARYRGLVSASIVDQQESIVLQAQSNLLGKVETIVQDLRQQIKTANEGTTTGQPSRSPRPATTSMRWCGPRQNAAIRWHRRCRPTTWG